MSDRDLDGQMRTVDGSAPPGVQNHPLSLGVDDSGPAGSGHLPSPEPVGSNSGSAGQGAVPQGRPPRMPGEPWRMPRLAKPQSGTGSVAALPDVSSADRPAGLRREGSAAMFSEDQFSGALPSAVRVPAQPPVPGSGHPGAPLSNTSTSGSPLADVNASALSAAALSAAAPSEGVPAAAVPPTAYRPDTSPSAQSSAVQPSAAVPPAAQRSAAAPAPQSPAPSLPATERVQASAASRPSVQLPAVQPPSARSTAAAPPATINDTVNSSGRELDRVAPAVISAALSRGQLTPSLGPASRPSVSQAETGTRPPAPTLSIGTIEVTLVPPPQAPEPARPARREPPQRLSRGLGPRYGQGQA
jgi:hypothetical protein